MATASDAWAMLIADLRAACALPEAERLAAGARALARLLAHPQALAPYRHALALGPGPWTLYTDPDHSFVITLLRKPRGGTTPVHHHGEAWTLYGIAEGLEIIHRYERAAVPSDGPALVRRVADYVRGPGEVEIEPPFAIHNETTGDQQDTIAVAVRGRELATTEHEWFDLASGRVTRGRGPASRPLPAPPE